jgi:membrane-bound metal-dependent hydrolase YbcI (DUF457 family)
MFLIWLVAVLAQAPLGLSTPWAVLDAIRHGAAAALTTVWLVPRYGWKPLVAGCLAGVALDLDHAVAARSLDPAAMMGLGVRPATHSLVGAVAFGLVAWPLFGHAVAYAVGAGMVAHIVEDSLSWPGVPLLAPLIPAPHVLLPAIVAALVVSTLGLLSATLGGSLKAGRLRRKRKRPRCKVE